MIGITIAWGIFSLIWLANILLGLYKSRKLKKFVDDAKVDLDTMTSILEKFKRSEMPLDEAIIEAHMRCFEHAERSFESKMELYEKFK